MPRRIAVVALALAAVGCRGSTEPVARPAVDIAPARAEGPVGRPVTVEVTVTNTTGRAFEVSGDLGTLLEARDAAGRVAFFGRSGFFSLPISRGPVVLAPGASARDRPSWDGVVGTDASGRAVRAPAGAYQVRAVVRIFRRSGRLVVGDEAYSAPFTLSLTGE